MIKMLENRHRGQRAVIVCNGPSLNDMNLSFLKHEICFGLNKIYLGFQKFCFYPKYYVSVNEKVLRQSEREIKKLTCRKFLSNRCSHLFEENSLTHILNSKNPPTRFCKDISLGIEEGWTVTYAALQIAYFLGFNQVIIIGMDHRFSYSGQANAESVMNGEDTNHFSPNYFADGVSWDNPDLENSNHSYALARKVFEEDGRKIFDATVDGGCDIFEKRDYKTFFYS